MPVLLEGIKVVEFSEVIAGPWGGMMLADLGAEVVKVEPVEGEPWRYATAFSGSESRWFISLNRGKRDLAVNLRREAGRAIVHRLVADADVVIVNYRPDTPATLGIDYETLSELNPRLVYVEATAFGRQGPEAHRPGYDLIVQAVSGLLAADGKTSEAGVPAPTNPPVADYGTGYAIAWAASTGLFSRERTGRGLKVEVSLLAVALGMLSYGFMEMPGLPKPDVTELQRRAWRQGHSRQERDTQRAETLSRLAAANVYYRCYETADSVIAVAALNNPLRRKFLGVVGLEDDRLDERGLSEGPEAAEIAVVLVAMTEIRMKERTTAEWLEAFDAAGVPAGAYKTAVEMVDDPQVVANGMVIEQEHPAAGLVRMMGPVLRPVGHQAEPARPSPLLGEHVDEVLEELGYSGEEIDHLRADGVIR
jgi:crotonobetainyl-CoA:carnitine CoA-transferase CaiB-like acyl-CoA transferase